MNRKNVKFLIQKLRKIFRIKDRNIEILGKNFGNLLVIDLNLCFENNCIIFNMNYLFEWDNLKSNLNLTKHKVRFETATSIFKDPRALSIFDDEHSVDEERWITIGLANSSQLILAVHTFEELDSNNVKIRIISARKATKNEIIKYEGEL